MKPTRQKQGHQASSWRKHTQQLQQGCFPFSFNTQVPALGRFPQFIVASMLDVHISMFNSVAIQLGQAL
jgi:hypothetical protein